ncbi:MAG: hypothetical protein GY788_16185 [bacterium]|nr:hypothetical protein [bacterium]
MESPDILTVQTSAGDHLFSRPSPPFVHHAVMAESETRRGPMSLDLVAEWIVSSWPGRGQATWRQVFRDGTEVGSTSVDDLRRPADIKLEVTYGDFVGFLYGLTAFEEASDGVNVLSGGIGVMSCLSGLVFRDTALRVGSTPSFERHAIADVCASSRLDIQAQVRSQSAT